jgi:hypothetical protein
MNNQKLIELKSLYENKLKDKVKCNYTPFFVRMSDSYDGKNGVLFVGKAENMEDSDNTTIEDAFCKAQKGMNKDKIVEKPKGKAARSAYNRVVQLLAKYLKEEKGINHFARTNLFKLSSTKDYKFGSEFDKAYLNIFKKEIELLQPKYVIMLTSGLENPFLDKLGKKQSFKKAEFQYTNKGNKQSKNIKSIKFDGLETTFITAFHPQGKPEKELVRIIKSLI